MPDDPLAERVAAVERALADAEHRPPDGADEPAADPAVRDRVAALEDDVAELEAAVQALRGYVGGVRHVNEDVARRADAAMAKATAVEDALDDDGGRTTQANDGDQPTDGGAAPAGAADARPEDVSDAARGTGRGCPRCGNPQTERGSSPSDGGPGEQRGPRSSSEHDRGERQLGEPQVGELQAGERQVGEGRDEDPASTPVEDADAGPLSWLRGVL